MYQVESLCDRIVLIDEGKTVLYGAVEEIKRNFAGNAIMVSGQGDFTHLPGVVEARQQNGTWHMALEIGIDPRTVLQALTSRKHVKIKRFELEEPSLDDIFINVVQKSAAKLEAKNA